MLIIDKKDWPEWLVIVEFVVNNKIHSATKMSLFIVNYGRELRMEADIRRKEKAEKAMEFAERMKKIQEEVSKKAQKEMNWQVEKLKRRYKVMLSTKDLVFKE